MNLEIARHLQQLRKQYGYSQERLAEKLGLSRQAISKWERAESSPDTDNLIELARLYGISIDELLLGRGAEAEIDPGTEPDRVFPESDSGALVITDADTAAADGSFVFIRPKPIGAEVDGDAESKPSVQAESCVKRYSGSWCRRHWDEFPYPVLTVIGFLIWGFCGGWAVSWTLFLTIPLYYSLIEAVQTRDAENFLYPVLVTFVFFLCGMLWDVWHPLWVLFLTIPIYYGLIEFCR